MFGIDNWKKFYESYKTLNAEVFANEELEIHETPYLKTKIRIKRRRGINKESENNAWLNQYLFILKNHFFIQSVFYKSEDQFDLLKMKEDTFWHFALTLH